MTVVLVVEQDTWDGEVGKEEEAVEVVDLTQRMRRSGPTSEPEAETRKESKRFKRQEEYN